MIYTAGCLILEYIHSQGLTLAQTYMVATVCEQPWPVLVLSCCHSSLTPNVGRKRGAEWAAAAAAAAAGKLTASALECDRQFTERAAVLDPWRIWPKDFTDMPLRCLGPMWTGGKGVSLFSFKLRVKQVQRFTWKQTLDKSSLKHIQNRKLYIYIYFQSWN